jgi:hypothetical protein
MISFKIQFWLICAVFIIYLFNYFILLKSRSLLNLGFWLVLTTFIYSIFPIVNYYFGGYEFGLLADNRLVKSSITDIELSKFYSYYLIYFTTLTLSIIFLKFKGLKSGIKVIIPAGQLKYIIIVYVFLQLFLFLMHKLYNIDFGRSQNNEDSIGVNLAAFSNAPYFVVQIASKINGILSITKISLIIFLTLNFKRYKRLIFFFFLIEISFLFINLGSRTGFFNLIFVFFLIYQQFIGKIKLTSLLVYFAIAFLFFNILGYIRSIPSDAISQVDLGSAITLGLTINNEFQALFATGFEVLDLVKSGIHFPTILYFNDIITIFPPSQLLPFQKIEASDWYLIHQGYKDSGTGFMWGVISQSLIGFGYIELVLRAFFLAIVGRYLHNKVRVDTINFHQILFYVFICLKAYYTFRNTTLGIVPFVVYEFIPYLLIIFLLELMIKRKVNLNYFKI